MIKVDDREIRELQKDLQYFKKKAMPHATRGYLNDAAFHAREIYQGSMRFEFVLKNRFTVGAVAVDKVIGYKVNSMESAMGSRALYMYESEMGATHTTGGEHGKPVPTSSAAGQGKNRNPRTRVVRGGNTMKAIKLTSRPRVGKGKQMVKVAILQAQRAGESHVFLMFSEKGTKGIFEIRKGGKIRMIWSLTKKSTTAKPKPLLATTMILIEPQLPRIYARAVAFQLTRARRLGY